MHTLTPGYTQKKSIVLIIFSSKKMGLTYSVAQSASLHVSSYFFWLPDPTRPCLPRTTLISSLLRTQNTSTFGEKNKNMCENPFTPICSCRKIQVFFIKSATSLSTACSPKLQRYTFSSLLALGGISRDEDSFFFNEGCLKVKETQQQQLLPENKCPCNPG